MTLSVKNSYSEVFFEILPLSVTIFLFRESNKEVVKVPAVLDFRPPAEPSRTVAPRTRKRGNFFANLCGCGTKHVKDPTDYE
jgi:hypothetical protein